MRRKAGAVAMVEPQNREGEGRGRGRSSPSGKTIILLGCLMALGLGLGQEIYRVAAGPNFQVVVPGKCYRSGQPSPLFLEDLVRTFGIRSVVNLRGANEQESWYVQETEAASRLGLQMSNVSLWGYHQPPAEEMKKLVEALDRAPTPILLHCQSGSDRTGLAAAIYLLLKTPTPLDQARKQLSLRFGHNSWGQPGCLDRLLDQYEKWLMGQDHSPTMFRQWAMEIYQPNNPSL